MIDSGNLRSLYIRGGIQKKLGLTSNLTALPPLYKVGFIEDSSQLAFLFEFCSQIVKKKKLKIPMTIIELI